LQDYNQALLIDLNFQTALLESLDWDETQFNSLLLYLKEALSSSISPDELFKHIKDNYNDNTFKFLSEFFNDIYIENGLYVKKEDDYEH
jgi:hypothetical protein